MKFTEEQKDLLAILPQDLQNSKELTDSAKLVLADIIFLYGMEDAKNNGYVFRSYDDLMKDTFINSKTSISKAIALLVQKEYIKVNSGRLKERKANEFTLINGTLLGEKCTEKCTDTNEKCTLTDYWTKKIESLENEILLLKKEIEELKKCTDKCTVKNEKCTTESDTDIDTDKEKDKDNTCIHEHEDLETKVTEDKKENIIKEKVNEMEREDKVTITHDHPSSLIEDKMSCVSDCNVYIPQNTDNSPTSHSEDDMDFDTYTSMDLKNRGIKERQRTTSIMSVNKGAGDVENTPMDNLSTSTEKTQHDAKEVAKTQCDERIASIKSDINLDKDCMLKAKTQIQFDAYFGDFKAKLNQLKTLLPIDEFNAYRAIQGKWWNATVQYLKFYKGPKQPKQPQQPTTVEMEYYRYHIESMFIAKSVEQMEKAITQISNWFDKMERSYSSSVMKKYEERFENDCVRVAHTNPIFKEWQNKATGEAQAA